jgi:hypothetical protein
MEDTVVVLTSDHGDCMGNQCLIQNEPCTTP